MLDTSTKVPNGIKRAQASFPEATERFFLTREKNLPLPAASAVVKRAVRGALRLFLNRKCLPVAANDYPWGRNAIERLPNTDKGVSTPGFGRFVVLNLNLN